MAWFLFILLLATGLAWWMAHRNLRYHVNHLERLARNLVEGKAHGTFVFYGEPQFTRIAIDLEKIAEGRESLERQLTKDRLHFEAILASMTEGVMVLGAARTIQMVNDSFCRLFALDDKPLGRSVLAALRDVAVDGLVRATLQTGEPQSREITQITAEGGTRYLLANAVPLKSCQPDGGGIVVVFHDLSRLRQLEDVRRQFVANVSHELRTPLAIFQGYIETLLDAPEMPRQELETILNTLHRHSLRLNAVLNDLLTLAKLEGQQESLRLEPNDLGALLARIGQDWQAPFEAKGVSLKIAADPGLPRLEADSFRLEQVLGNLLENALKYTPAGGVVAIEAAAENSQIELRVRDSGSGIPAADLPHIFERFYRVEKSRTRDTGGTGLGLSIVKHIMLLHQGTVHAESTIGEGTAIILRFPRARQ